MAEFGLMCFILLEKPARLNPAAVQQALADAAPRSDLKVKDADPGDGGTGLVAEIDGHPYVVVSESGQAPAEIAEMVAGTGLFRAEREQGRPVHDGFLAIAATDAVTGHGLVRAQAVALTRLAVAVARTVPAVALVWPGAGTAAPIGRLDDVLSQIQKDWWPIDIWIGFQFGLTFRDGKQMIGARSRGAVTFFGSEIEVYPIATSDKTRPLRIIMHVASHLMAYGVHVQQGQSLQIKGEPPMQFLLQPPEGGRPGAIRLVPAQAAVG